MRGPWISIVMAGLALGACQSPQLMDRTVPDEPVIVNRHIPPTEHRAPTRWMHDASTQAADVEASERAAPTSPTSRRAAQPGHTTPRRRTPRGLGMDDVTRSARITSYGNPTPLPRREHALPVMDATARAAPAHVSQLGATVSLKAHRESPVFTHEASAPTPASPHPFDWRWITSIVLITLAWLLARPRRG